MRPIVGVLRAPASTMAAVVSQPTFAAVWALILLVVVSAGAGLLFTDLGRQALVDERVRVIESLGGRVDDAAYAALQAHPPITAFVTSGGRLLLTPPVTLLVALGLMVLARMDRRPLTYRTAIAVTVHASVVLALQQLIALPLHVVRESLTSPTTLASLWPMMDEGSWPARLAGSIDVFGLWWVALLGVGLSAATGIGTGRAIVRLLAIYVGVAAIAAGAFVVLGSQGLLAGGSGGM